MARTAFDAYVHELFALRDIPHLVKFAQGVSGRARLSRENWRLIDDSRRSLDGLTRAEKGAYTDVRELNVADKLQALLLLVCTDRTHVIIAEFEERFRWLFALNTVRNAIVHHDFDVPSSFLTGTCDAIRASARLPSKPARGPWEEILLHPPLAEWACRVVGNAILEVESVEEQRRIHPVATRDAVVSAIAPLKLS